MVTQALVAVSDLRHAYADGQTALDGVSFEVGSGEKLAIVGANGAGKSTTLLHLAGCLLPQAGSVRIADLLLCRENLPQLRRRVGMLFQNPDDQLFMPRVYDDVSFGPVNLGLPAEEVNARVMQALAVVDATHLLHRQPHRLSTGEKRAVAIASVLALSPAILAMDEPTSSLDPASRRQLIELLQTLEQTLIIATHDLDMVLDLCPRTLVLDAGTIVADGASAVILQDAELLATARLEKPLRLQACPLCGGDGGTRRPPEAALRAHRKELKRAVKRQRATIIVELDGSILLVENRGGLVLLPGGGVHADESRLQAAARELAEETRLVAQSLLFLFEHESATNRHSVFWAAASGTALAGDDATALHRFAAEDEALCRRMSAASRQIIERFLELPRGTGGVPRPPADAAG